MSAFPAETIPCADPLAGFAPHQPAIRAAIDRVLTSGRYVLGPEVEAFEHEFAAYHSVGHCIGVANGTDALELALRAVGIGVGDEVATVANTATATTAAIAATGATPRFVEVDDSTFNLDPPALARCLATHPIKAIVPVHLYGHPCDMTRINELARASRIPVIEDCAQAHGARWQGRLVGTEGTLAAFSFYPTKNLGCLGDGGAVLTRDSALADRVRSLRQYGWRERYVAVEPGRNSRLDELQAAVLRVLLPSLDDRNTRRRQIASRYRAALSDRDLILPEESPGAVSSWHQFVIRSPGRDELRNRLAERGIGTAVLYPAPIHRQPAYARRELKLPVTERLCAELLCLPVYPGLADGQVDRVCQAMRAVLAEPQL